MKRAISQKICTILLGALMLLAALHAPAQAEPDEDLQTLGMFYEGKDLVVAATRNPKPLSQSAENITIVTAAEIEMMGAHTLPDALNNVSGLNTENRGSVATFDGVFIQGADFDNILVLLDGVTLNFLGAALADIAPIPVQNIERIEIVKGPGSTSWGSSLGGVINIVTKSPYLDRQLAGALSFSTGDRGTRDARGEATGTIGPLGYYLYAGSLVSGGLSPNTALDLNNLYSKLRWGLQNQGSLLFTFAYTTQSVGEATNPISDPPYSSNDHKRNLISTLALNHPLSGRVDLDLSLRTTYKYFKNAIQDLVTGAPLPPDFISRESTIGGSAQLTWRGGNNTLAAGTDFDHVHLDYEPFFPGFSPVSRSDKLGIFVNDTLTIGDLAISPGVRYDHMQPVGDFYSASLGAAWKLNEQTIVRCYGARGYSLPLLTPNTTQEKVLTAQGGVETTLAPSLWLKASLFWNHITDSLNFDTGNLNTLLRQGIEVEAKTVPLYNTFLTGGYTFIDFENSDTDKRVPNTPRQIVKMGLHYDDKQTLTGALLGRYVRWNSAPGNFTKDNAIIWDLILAGKVFTLHDTAVELFFNGHNIFNGSQYNSDSRVENTPRWLEGGIRCNF